MRLILNFVMNGIGVTRRLYLFQVLVHEVLDGIPVWMQEIPKQASADIQQKSPEIGYYCWELGTVNQSDRLGDHVTRGRNDLSAKSTCT